jgi:tRNA pseudouridine38-40 synthase
MPDPQTQRLALGLSYRGTHYHGWQSQPDGRTLQDRVEAALTEFAASTVSSICAGRTDSGVHALNQVLHFDTLVQRDAFAWVRGTNRYLERDIALQWCQPVAADFHARRSALGRRYRYLLLQSAVRPALEQGLCGWCFKPLDGAAMRAAAALLIGEHDFSSFRAAECQSPGWMAEVLAARSREAAAPTFAPDGLYFVGPYYDARHGIPDHTPAMDWLL